MEPQYEFGEFVVTTDAAWLDEDLIHKVLSTGYWAEGIPREVVARSIRNSLCFGVFEGAKQVGFARVISDYATFAYLADVFLIESHRGRTGEISDGMHFPASGIARPSALDAAHPRCARVLRAVRF